MSRLEDLQAMTVLDMNQYQDAAATFAIYPPAGGLTYTVLGLASEAGEVAGKLKKSIRDGDFATMKQDMASELGDVLWYVAMAAKELGLTLDEIATDNINKLQDRKDRGVIKGSGDTR